MEKDTFGINLRRLRKERKLTLEELANILNEKYGTNINKSMLSKWENGHPASISFIKILSLYFDKNLNELLGFNVKKDKNTIPILRNKDLDKEQIDEMNIIGYGALPPLMPIKDELVKDLFYIRVSDDFMDKVYPESSIVLIRKNIPFKDGDDVLAILSGDDKAILARIEQDDNFVFLIPVSNNSEHRPIILNINDQSVKVIGKVIAGTIINQ